MIQRPGEHPVTGVDHSVWLCHHGHAGTHQRKRCGQRDEISCQVHVRDVELTCMPANPPHEARGAKPREPDPGNGRPHRKERGGHRADHVGSRVVAPDTCRQVNVVSAAEQRSALVLRHAYWTAVCRVR
jgi:hypothetical protein